MNSLDDREREEYLSQFPTGVLQNTRAKADLATKLVDKLAKGLPIHQAIQAVASEIKATSPGEAIKKSPKPTVAKSEFVKNIVKGIADELKMRNDRTVGTDLFTYLNSISGDAEGFISKVLQQSRNDSDVAFRSIIKYIGDEIAKVSDKVEKIPMNDPGDRGNLLPGEKPEEEEEEGEPEAGMTNTYELPPEYSGDTDDAAPRQPVQDDDEEIPQPPEEEEKPIFPQASPGKIKMHDFIKRHKEEPPDIIKTLLMKKFKGNTPSIPQIQHMLQTIEDEELRDLASGKVESFREWLARRNARKTVSSS